MKRYINKGRAVIFFALSTLLFSLGSCQDMLETESSSQLVSPALDEKTDSVFYAYGILQAMQQLADQYYFQNEVRGELVQPTTKANVNLKNMANYGADITNKYDSVYLYYKVINNCNYYLKHRRTDLQTGGRLTSVNEYIAVASIRAWAYLQLMRNYGSAPYITEPVTTISEINANQSFTDMKPALTQQAEYLEGLKAKYSYDYWEVPTFGRTSDVAIGLTSFGRTKYIRPNKCFIPLNVILGELYLEIGEYEKAAKAYYDYLYYAGLSDTEKINVNYSQRMNPRNEDRKTLDDFDDYDSSKNRALYSSALDWNNIFNMSAQPGDVITYIPMATTQSNGQVTNVPQAFGYVYYGGDGTAVSNYRINGVGETADIQLIPSEAFDTLSFQSPYYYFKKKLSTSQRFFELTSVNIGDARANFIVRGEGADSSCVFVQKPSTGNFYLYRTSTVYLHLAEAFNRMGHPDAAFAILKDGISPSLKSYVDTMYYHQSTSASVQTFEKENFYVTTKTAEMLNTTIPFLANSTVFPNGPHSVGIHFHGAGAVAGLESPYQYNTIVGNKIQDLSSRFNLSLGEPTLQDSINAMEDILCDEYALEFAFEGTRFADLQRMARHKNEAGTYGANFGSLWFADKMKAKNPVKDLTDPKNWYLPFK